MNVTAITVVRVSDKLNEPGLNSGWLNIMEKALTAHDLARSGPRSVDRDQKSQSSSSVLTALPMT